jgi:cyclopropane-fatty-acyl-phospholipid synthase
VEIRLQDYREASADKPFDRIVAVGFYEHLGPKYRPEFFAMIKKNLAPSGRAVVQGITIRDDLYPKFVRSTDFIQKYIFPGTSLASPEVFAREAQENGLKTVSTRLLGLHYVETLRRWSENFEAALPEVRKLGFDDHFIRMWRYYLAYSIAGFLTQRVDLMQTVLRPAGED